MPVLAHDAFGEFGPFYASLLHPLADPLQAALLVGTAAFLAGRSLSAARIGLPVFAIASTFAACALAGGVSASVPTILAACAAIVAGLAAMLPATRTPWPATLALVAGTGTLTGLAPDSPPGGGMVQPFLGTVLGIAALATLSWFALEKAGRDLSPIVPRVAGSWVAAVGILIAAFAL